MGRNILKGFALGSLIVLCMGALVQHASAACSGGAVAACECGDTVISNTVLTTADPVVFIVTVPPDTPCAANGLTVNAGLTLDLGGNTIAGRGSGAGIVIAGADVTLTNGTVTGFATGVRGTTDGSTIEEVTATRNGDGIAITGNMNLFSGNGLFANTNNGLIVAGNENTIDSNSVGDKGAGNGANGIVVRGNRNLINDHNAVFANGLDGIVVTGNGNVIETNNIGEREKGNGCVGIRVAGSTNKILNNDVYANNLIGCLTTVGGILITGNGNSITKNEVGDRGKGNGGDGIQVSGTSNTVEQNKSMANGGDGIEVSGGGASGPNVLTRNAAGDRGKGNGGNGIFIHDDRGNGTPNPVEVDSNTTRANALNGILIAAGATGHELRRNISGGTKDQTNRRCEFDVAAGNFNATGNTANGKAIKSLPNNRDGEPFPTGCRE